MSHVLYRGAGGTVTLPIPARSCDRLDGGQLVVHPARRVWDRTALDAAELTQWNFLVAAAASAMLETLPQLHDGCVNYWDAGNWALNPDAPPAGPKSGPAHRVLHQHLIGRSRQSSDAAWVWGEAPFYPSFADRFAWSSGKAPLTAAECGVLVPRLAHVLHDRDGVTAPRRRAVHACGYPTPGARFRRGQRTVSGVRAVSTPAPRRARHVGTTVQADDAVPRAFTAALAGEGVTLTPAQPPRCAAPPSGWRCASCSPGTPTRRARDPPLRSISRGAARHGHSRDRQPVMGVAGVLKRSRTAGVKVALNTGFDRELTAHLLGLLAGGQTRGRGRLRRRRDGGTPRAVSHLPRDGADGTRERGRRWPPSATRRSNTGAGANAGVAVEHRRVVGRARSRDVRQSAAHAPVRDGGGGAGAARDPVAKRLASASANRRCHAVGCRVLRAEISLVRRLGIGSPQADGPVTP